MTSKISRRNSCGKFPHSMTIPDWNSVTIGGTILFLLFLIAGAIPYWQQQFHYFNAAEAGEGGCIGFDEVENTIAVACNASFLDVVQTINNPEILEDLGNGEYILKGNLEVADGVIFEMTSNSENLQYLKIAGENGIIIYGKMLIDGVKITSWDISGEESNKTLTALFAVAMCSLLRVKVLK